MFSEIVVLMLSQQNKVLNTLTLYNPKTIFIDILSLKTPHSAFIVCIFGLNFQNSRGLNVARFSSKICKTRIVVSNPCSTAYIYIYIYIYEIRLTSLNNQAIRKTDQINCLKREIYNYFNWCFYMADKYKPTGRRSWKYW